MEFMSPDHVAAMNDQLRVADEVRAACLGLDRPRVMLFRLGNGPEGRDVFWAVTFDDTISFALVDHPAPDIVLAGDWRKMMTAVRAGRDGEPASPDLRLQGDPALFEHLNGIFDIARPMATLETDLPDA